MLLFFEQMNSWFLFAVIGQFMYAVVVLTDRFIVTKNIVSKPIVYSFYVSFLSIFAIFALPFGVTIPSIRTIMLSIAVAISFIFSIYTLYASLKKSNPTEVVPVIGGVAAISAFVFSYVFLKTWLPAHFVTGFIILVTGMMLISHFKFTLRSFFYLTSSGIFFGLSTVIIKAIFDQETIINGFFWTRMANVVIALMLLLIPGVWSTIKDDYNQPNKSNKTALVIGNKILAAMGFIFILISIKYGNVSLVNALTAAQYVFLLIFAIFFSRLLPEYFEETVHRHEFLHKILATIMIVIGFFVLFI